MASATELKVIIVGSGLAGLTAARVLREHHQVVVYERGTASIATGGQGIMIAPNAAKILKSLGYNSALARAVPVLGVRTYDRAGEVLEDFGMELESRFGATFLAQKRSDFREELMRLATMPSAELGIQGAPAKVVFRQAVTALEPEKGEVTLSDGTVDIADVVIVADGIHSRLRNCILDNDAYVARTTGLTCYRIAVSVEEAKKALRDLPLPHWWDPHTCQSRSSIILAGDGSGRLITAYPISSHTQFNLSCILPTQGPTRESSTTWYTDGDCTEMMRNFGDFAEPVRRILSAATNVKVWELQDLETLPSWTKGRSIIIGDAAHAMTPMLGQGANMSVEDGESLRLLAGSRREEVPGLLRLLASERRARVAYIMEETRKAHFNGGLVERLARSLEFTCSYHGIHAALELRKAKGATGHE